MRAFCAFAKSLLTTRTLRVRFSFGFLCTGPGCREPFTDAATDRGGPRRRQLCLALSTKLARKRERGAARTPLCCFKALYYIAN